MTLECLIEKHFMIAHDQNEANYDKNAVKN
jgi:hypothetical protein